jgi:hypothetical protein
MFKLLACLLVLPLAVLAQSPQQQDPPSMEGVGGSVSTPSRPSSREMGPDRTTGGPMTLAKLLNFVDNASGVVTVGGLSITDCELRTTRFGDVHVLDLADWSTGTQNISMYSRLFVYVADERIARQIVEYIGQSRNVRLTMSVGATGYKNHRNEYVSEAIVTRVEWLDKSGKVVHAAPF